MSRYGLLGPLTVILQRADQIAADANDENGRTPLSYDAARGHKAVVRLLLEKGANTEAADKVIRMAGRRRYTRPPHSATPPVRLRPMRSGASSPE